MKDLDFLNKLSKEKKIVLIDTNENLALSYEKKSGNCLLAAKLLHKGELFAENSIGEAYYSFYNAVQSLFFRCGIKCENHSGSAILLRELFKQDTLTIPFTKAKEERIDKQYYTPSLQMSPATIESSKQLIAAAERFILEVSSYKRMLSNEEVRNLRIKAKELLGN